MSTLLSNPGPVPISPAGDSFAASSFASSAGSSSRTPRKRKQARLINPAREYRHHRHHQPPSHKLAIEGFVYQLTPSQEHSTSRHDQTAPTMHPPSPLLGESRSSTIHPTTRSVWTHPSSRLDCSRRYHHPRLSHSKWACHTRARLRTKCRPTTLPSSPDRRQGVRQACLSVTLRRQLHQRLPRDGRSCCTSPTSICHQHRQRTGRIMTGSRRRRRSST